MPNHVHLVAVTETKEGLGLAIGEAHRHYTRRINFREGWRGHLRQGRFSSCILDEGYLLACTRYVELNPVSAGIVKKPESWRWSSAKAHVKRRDDILSQTKPLLSKAILRKHERTGRPIGDEAFIQRLERLLDRRLKPKWPGPKPRDR